MGNVVESVSYKLDREHLHNDDSSPDTDHMKLVLKDRCFSKHKIDGLLGNAQTVNDEIDGAFIEECLESPKKAANPQTFKFTLSALSDSEQTDSIVRNKQLLTKEQLKKAYNEKADIQMKRAIDSIPKQNQVSHINEKFTYRKTLAKGGSCSVLLCDDNETKECCALKEMSKHKKVHAIQFLTEVGILKSLQKHPNILAYSDAFIDNKCFYISTRYCSGGTLLSRIIETKRFNEKIASQYIKTILETVQFFHSKNIYHRDLKPNNIMFDKPGNEGVIKIIDFGEAIIIEEDDIDDRFVGTVPFFTPEMLNSRIRTGKTIMKGDIWCIGVISYILLTGKYPWIGNTKSETVKNIQLEPLKWGDHVSLSPHCKDFIAQLLNKNHEKRLDAKTALKHEWIIDKHSNDDLGYLFRNEIHKFARKETKWQEMITHACLAKWTPEQRTLLLDTVHNEPDNPKESMERHLIYTVMEKPIFDNIAQKQNPRMYKALMAYKSKIDDGLVDFDDIFSETGMIGFRSSSDPRASNSRIPRFRLQASIDTTVGASDCGTPKQELVKRCMTMKVRRSYDVYTDEKDEKDNDDFEFEANIPISQSDTAIAVDDIRDLMSEVSHIYDIEEILANLDSNNTGFVEMHAFRTYNRPLHLVDKHSSNIKQKPKSNHPSN